MTNEKLTEHMLELVKSVAIIEANTSCIPQLKRDFEIKCSEIDQNTRFRKASVKLFWIAVTATVTGVVSVIVGLSLLIGG